MRDISEQHLKKLGGIYRLYLDESGSSGFSASTKYRLPRERYFTLAGILIRGDTYFKELEPRILHLKEKYFGSRDHVLHFTEIFFRRDGGGLMPGVSEKFWMEFLSTLSEVDCELLSITIDKQRMQEQYRELYPPYHLVIAWMIERIVYSLTRFDKRDAQGFPYRGQVIIEARGGSGTKEAPFGPDRQLEVFYRKVFYSGSGFFGEKVSPAQVQRRLVSERIMIRDKNANNIGLQIADLVCFPLQWNTLLKLCKHDVVAMIGGREAHMTVESFWQTMQHRLARDPRTNKIEGWGIKIFPSDLLLPLK